MNVREVQCRLWKESQDQRKYRLSNGSCSRADLDKMRNGGLMNLVCNPVWFAEAARRVLKNSRGKVAGVDDVTVQIFEVNRERNIEALRMKLKRGAYRPRPTKRGEIPKPGGTMRPLGIPALEDKIVQESVRMVLEPIFEPEFHDSSYGFRPRRSVSHAVFSCRNHIRNGYDHIIEGDIKSCFDEIAHKAILMALREKIGDKKFIELVHGFHKAGVSIDGTIRPTTKGVPQGGIISPILANVVLNKLDWFLNDMARQDKYTDMQFVRYADDWCVFLRNGDRQQAERLKEEIAMFLKQNGSLELSLEKTRITDVQDGFDFLGFGIRKEKEGVRIRIGEKKQQGVQDKVIGEIQSIPDRRQLRIGMEQVSRIIRGWGEHARLADNFPCVAEQLDVFFQEAMTERMSRLERITPGQCRNNYCRQGTIQYEDMALWQLTWMEVRHQVPEPKRYFP